MAYVPTSRRPIANMFRWTAASPVDWCVRLGVHPNWVSYGSVVASAAAALCFWQAAVLPALLIPAVLFCYVRLWLNMLDGMVALSSGKASPVGEIVNELPDRVSDVLIFVGVAHSGLCHPLTAYWAALSALFVAYVGTLGQAVGAEREFGGLMSKPWRMVVLHAGAWTTLALLWWGDGRLQLAGFTVLDWTNLIVIAGCAETVVVRLIRIVNALHAKARTAGTKEP